MPVHPVPSVALSEASLATLAGDALVLTWFEEETVLRPDVSEATGGALAASLAAREFRGKPYEALWLPILGSGWAARRLLVIGGGRRQDYNPERARRVAFAAGLMARQRRRR